MGSGESKLESEALVIEIFVFFIALVWVSLIMVPNTYAITRPSCISTQPIPIPDASQYTSKGFSISGLAKTGAVVNNLFRV